MFNKFSCVCFGMGYISMFIIQSGTANHLQMLNALIAGIILSLAFGAIVVEGRLYKKTSKGVKCLLNL